MGADEAAAQKQQEQQQEESEVTSSAPLLPKFTRDSSDDEADLKQQQETSKGLDAAASSSSSSPPPASLFNWGYREPQDVHFGTAFKVVVAVVLIWGAILCFTALFAPHSPLSYPNLPGTCPFPDDYVPPYGMPAKSMSMGSVEARYPDPAGYPNGDVATSSSSSSSSDYGSSSSSAASSSSSYSPAATNSMDEGGNRRRLLQYMGATADDVSMTSSSDASGLAPPLPASLPTPGFFSYATPVLVTILVGLPLGFLYLWLMQNATQTLVYASLPLVIGMPSLLGIALLLTSATAPLPAGSGDGDDIGPIFWACVLFLISLVWAFLLYRRRDQLALTIRLLKVASESLKANPKVLTFVPAIQATALLSSSLLLLMLFLSLSNGMLVPNPQRRYPDWAQEGDLPPMTPREDAADGSGSSGMYNSDFGSYAQDPGMPGAAGGAGYAEPGGYGSAKMSAASAAAGEVPCGPNTMVPECCQWQPSPVAQAFAWTAGGALLWVAFVVQEVLVFVVAGTVAQWYFMPVGSSTAGNLERSLSHATGPSFGTVCFAGLVMSLMEILRSLVRQATDSRGGSGGEQLLKLLIRCCLEWILSMLEFMTKFATMFASMTGHGFVDSARSSFDLLRRNFLSTIVVDSLSGAIMMWTTLIIAVVWGTVVGVSFKWTWGQDNVVEAVLLGLGCGFIMIWVLGMFVKVIHLAVDAIYICYAVDKDNSYVTKPEIHEAYILLPSDPNTSQPMLAMPETRPR